MQFFITILHIVLCFVLILIILLQPGKDGAAVFGGGGGGNQMYGPRGQGNLLGRATTLVAALFMVTSISLAWYSSATIQQGSDIDDILEAEEADLAAEQEGENSAALPPRPPPSASSETERGSTQAPPSIVPKTSGIELDAATGSGAAPATTPEGAATAPAAQSPGDTTENDAPAGAVE